MKRYLALFFTSMVVLLACGETRLGQECDEAGGDGECEDGAICGRVESGALLCMKICNDQAQCLAAEACNGVEGSNIKACHPRVANSKK